ncbi:MAG TPA: sigma-54 factor interaction domain-containing protein, partial [Desulfobulbaceae bacterium]|nr:sigma-54 factor interaction domain-containing protein [Desulfobulbaceae bacterium]
MTKRTTFQNIIGNCEVMQRLFELIGKLAEDDLSTVLIQGESGTGKELVAKAIHRHSPRKGENFVPINCAAIPEDLLESELFGYTKGAFTGATNAKTGRIKYADGGSLFLDEIGDMKPILQAKLLRVLQEREFEPVGGLKPIPVDVRIIAATHRNLEQMVDEGKFREDLYYRLSVIPVNIP